MKASLVQRLRRQQQSTSRGSVAVEFALTLPALVVVLTIIVSALAWVQAAVKVQEIASTAARITMTEGRSAGLEYARSSGPVTVTVHEGSLPRLSVSMRGPWGVAVTASAHVPPRG